MPALLLTLLPIWSGFKTSVAWLFAFFSKPPGVYILAVILIAIAIWWSGQRGYQRGGAECEARHQVAAQKEVVRQKTVFQQVGDRSDVRTAESGKINNSNEKVVQHVKDEAAARPDAPRLCVPADIADELRSLK
jgi:hypothetical protein